MPATWPAVPYRVLRSSGAITEAELVGRSQTDSGLARQRAMFTAAPDKVTGTIRMTYAQYETFAAWRKGLKGSTANWLGHPSGGTKEVRFVAGEQGTPTPDGQTSKWLVPVSMEIIA